MTRHVHFRPCPLVQPARAPARSPRRQANQGFTLIEISVALFIITLILGSILVPLGTQVEQKQISDTQKIMDEIKAALLGFVTANGYLPCPDDPTSGDGVSDPSTPGVCTNAEGFVPWVTLNVAREDTWGNRFRYRVSPEFTNTPASTCATGDGRLGLCDSGIIRINTRNSTTKATQILVSTAAAIIISHGKNGYGATASDGTARTAVPVTNVDETANTNTDTTFASRTATGAISGCSDVVAGQPFCEFDDIVTWISAYSIFNRMVTAGKLP